MPWKAQLTVTRVIHHLMSRDNGGMQIFIDDKDRRFFLSVLENLLEKTGTFRMHGALWTIITTFMRLLNGKYAHYFRRKSKTRGYLFQNRYKSIVTQDQNYIEELVRYIHKKEAIENYCEFLKSGLEKEPEFNQSMHGCSKEEIIRRGRKDWRSRDRKMCAYILNHHYELPVI